MPGSRRQSGFTLLEAVAALTLLGLGLGILYAGYLQAARIEAKAARTEAAFDLARSVLDQAEAGAISGGWGEEPQAPGLAWEIIRAPLEVPGLDRLTAVVTWREERPRSLGVWTAAGHGP